MNWSKSNLVWGSTSSTNSGCSREFLQLAWKEPIVGNFPACKRLAISSRTPIGSIKYFFIGTTTNWAGETCFTQEANCFAYIDAHKPSVYVDLANAADTL